MNTNLAIGWNFSGWVHMYLGKHQTSLEHLRHAARLSPRDTNVMQTRFGMAFAHIFDGQYEEALLITRRITEEFPTFMPAWRAMAVGHALGGDPALADKAAKKALELDPTGTVAVLASLMPLRRLQDRERWKDGLARAGFPQ